MQDGAELMTPEIGDARDVIEIAKDYVRRSVRVTYWEDLHICELDEKTGYWRVVFTASESLLDPSFKYEIFIDAKTGQVKRAGRLAQSQL
ncbi:MAG: hypothetical protein QW057_03690 [Candidatus Bathyarchaeia archaeon]